MLAVLRLRAIRMIDPPDLKTTTLRYRAMRARRNDSRSIEAESHTLSVNLKDEVTEILSVEEQP